jgi:hypothetical protein
MAAARVPRPRPCLRGPQPTVHPFFQQLLDNLKSGDSRHTGGARIVADIPIADEWINELLAARISGREGAVMEARLRSLPDRRAQLHLRLRKFSFIPLQVHLFIEEQPDLPASPVLVARWETISAAVTSIASRAVSAFNDLPPGVVLGGDRVAVNIFAVLDSQGLGWIIPLLERAQLTTDTGRLLLHLAVRVPEGGNVRGEI